MKVVVAVPPGLELEGAQELIELGAQCVKPAKRFVSCEVDQPTFYRIFLRARLPFRVLREIARFHCDSKESLYCNIQNSFNWESWLTPAQSFRVDISGRSLFFSHSHFTALQVKNAIVDLQRERWGQRSSININQPDIVLHLHVNDFECVLSLDGSSQSLHKRGYRYAMSVAPLKENLAAGLIRMTHWERNTPLVDPLCGSGTFLLEAASLALGLAPGLDSEFIFQKWFDFDSITWMKEKGSLKNLNHKDRCLLPEIIGCEENLEIANNAKINVRSAGMENIIKIHHQSFDELTLPSNKGVLVCNPPYGKRLGDLEQLKLLYKKLGDYCKRRASGWDLWVLSGNPTLSKELRLKSSQKIPINNGGIDCRWLHYKIN